MIFKMKELKDYSLFHKFHKVQFLTQKFSQFISLSLGCMYILSGKTALKKFR